MRTPDEIKTGLRYCSRDEYGCKECNYKEECDTTGAFAALSADALAYICHLEMERDALLYAACSAQAMNKKDGADKSGGKNDVSNNKGAR